MRAFIGCLVVLTAAVGRAQDVIEIPSQLFHSNCTSEPSFSEYNSSEYCLDQEVRIECRGYDIPGQEGRITTIGILINSNSIAYIDKCPLGERDCFGYDLPGCASINFGKNGCLGLGLKGSVAEVFYGGKFSDFWGGIVYLGVSGVIVIDGGIDIDTRSKPILKPALYRNFLSAKALLTDHEWMAGSGDDLADHRIIEWKKDYPQELPLALFQFDLAEKVPELPCKVTLLFSIQQETESGVISLQKFTVDIDQTQFYFGNSTFVAISPVYRGMTVSAKLNGTHKFYESPSRTSVSRAEHISDIRLESSPSPKLLFKWNNVVSLELLGTVTATTSEGRPLNVYSAADPESNNNNYDCSIDMAGVTPVSGVLIKAGSLPDAQRLNQTNLSLFWHFGKPVRDRSNESVIIHWPEAPVKADFYKVGLNCEGNSTVTEGASEKNNKVWFRVTTPMLTNSTTQGVCLLLCNLVVIPGYGHHLHQEYQQELEGEKLPDSCLPAPSPSSSPAPQLSLSVVAEPSSVPSPSSVSAQGLPELASFLIPALLGIAFLSH